MPEESIKCEGNMDVFKEECKRKMESKTNLGMDIEDIKKIQDDIGKKLEAYSKKVSEFEIRKIKLEKYSNKWTPVINEAIKTKKAELDSKIKEYYDQKTSLEKEIPLLEKARTEAIKQLKMSEIGCEEKNNAYEEKKEYIIKLIKLDDKGIIKGNLDKLEFEWTKEIADAHRDDKPAMYGLMLEFNRVLTETTIKKPEELESVLYESWKASNDANKDCKEKKEKLEIVINKLEDKKQQLEKLKEELKDKIKTRISENVQEGAGKAGKPSEKPDETPVDNE
ncbi:MAG TPA: hypothetical protein VER35_01355 [Candidatus Limnocylindrales bacterium]|nr:hypothetical protein [Candidatus Limnocylindrales bacterium]